MRFFSIRSRLVLSYALLTVLTVGIVGSVALALVQQNLEQQERDYLSSNAQVIAKQAAGLFVPVPDKYSLQGLADAAAFLGSSQVRILDARNTVLADSGPRASERLLWIVPAPGLRSLSDRPVVIFGYVASRDDQDDPMQSFEQRLLGLLIPDARYTLVERQAKPVGNRIDFGAQAKSVNELNGAQTQNLVPKGANTPADGEFTRVSMPIQQNNRAVGTVEMISNLGYGLTALKTARNAFALAAVGATLLAIAAGLWVSRGLTAPLSKLTTATNRMAQGDLTSRAPIRPGHVVRNEVDLLADQFNAMAARLEQSFHELQAERDALRQFISDASHELRTPITALRMSNELLQGQAGDDASARAEFLAQNEAQLKRLQWITTNLLDLSRFDAGLMKLDLAVRDLNDVVEAAAEPFRLRADKRGVAFNVALLGAPTPARCDQARIEMALSNLIENALKFTSAGGAITVGLRPADGPSGMTRNVEIFVRDTGIGIPPDDLPHVFERFYRASNANAEGSGLGLAIVKSIAQAHGGSVRIESEVGKGSTFIMSLPVE